MPQGGIPSLAVELRSLRIFNVSHGFFFLVKLESEFNLQVLFTFVKVLIIRINNCQLLI